MDIWLAPGPANATCEETSIKGCHLLKANGTATRCFIYHNTELALEWLESQRAVMTDPSKKGYFLQYLNQNGTKNGTIYNEPITAGNQYFWDYTNPEAARYFVTSILAVVTDPAVDGTFTDDVTGFPAEHESAPANIHMNMAQVADLQFATQEANQWLIDSLVKLGKYNWQAFGNQDGVAPGPNAGYCSDWMREYCAPSQQGYPMMMQMDTTSENKNQTIAAFLIVRPPYGWIGWGWESDNKDWDPIFRLQVGEPMGLCQESPTGVFSRTWSEGTAVLNCNSWKATLPFASL